MAALSDTPTQPLLTSTSEAGVSIKLEQGVFHENDYGSGVYHNVERRGNPIINYDSNHPHTAAENGSNTLGNGNTNFTDSNVLQANIEIKSEPPVDIDDHYVEEGEENTSLNSLTQKETETPVTDTTSPQIRLTPTSKLIALSNTTTAEKSSQKRRYVCFYENCTKSYGKSSHLRSHLTWHTGIKPFVCQEPGCGKGFTRSDELNRHTRTHTGEKPFECIHCSKKFSRSDHLTKHLATHKKQSATGNGTYSKKMEKNPIAITNSSIVSTVTPLAISSVTESLESNIGFSEGMHFMAGLIENMHQKQCSTHENRTDHVEVTYREPIKIKLEKPGNSDEYQVVPQKQETQAASSLVEEMHNIKIPIDIKPEPIDETDLRIKTEVVPENEPDDDAIMPEANLPPLSLDSNIVPTTISAYVPSTTKASSYVPASTPSPFVMTSINSIPDTVYDPSRPFPCSTCTKCFKRQDDLNRHMRTHTGEKPFACNECEKRFMRSDHLKKHMNTHTRVRVLAEENASENNRKSKNEDTFSDSFLAFLELTQQLSSKK